ncbi:MAG: family metallo-hydrolase [Devosia sp.]|uniref:M20 family metallo-hydrolase n=1 Tax=Devosia sp. TaxID=1871048 RepID=UPI002605A7B9|nr:M20 family metallo-hydrolase [Devosia sp.]MDB5527136.1 family metallo-hydrolase [Devosia sp.]
MSRPSDHVDGERLWSRLMDLARFGARADGGVDRPALSAAEGEARAQVIAWGRAIGLTPFTDAAANLFLRLEGTDPSLPPVVSGSHTDSQPTGGKFDGAFGVLAALEALEAIIASGQRPHRTIEVVAWTNEEGSRFAPGMTGSHLFTGQMALADAEALKDAQGVTAGDAIAAILAGDDNVAVRPFGWPVSAYIEPHIEQASVLERAGKPLGVVTGIQGTRRYRVTVTGEAAHAGTATREERRDALLAAVRMIGAMEIAANSVDDFKFTVGMFNVTPNAPSVVPQEVLFSIDIRHPDNAAVDGFDETMRRIVEAEQGPCDAVVRQIVHAASLEFPLAIRQSISRHAAALGIDGMDVYSAAGHDARQMHYFCPSGMIFVPCRNGISHSPEEWAEPAHLAGATRLLADLLWDLANT